MKDYYKKRSKSKSLLSILLSFAMVWTMIPGLFFANTAYAAVGGPPEHAKMLQNNGDGTYKLALNVKGEAEKKIQKVNVIVIVDRSGSMNTDAGTGEVTYTPTSATSNGLYGLIDGEYVPLQRRGNGTFFNPYTFWYNNTQYTGTRYTRQQAQHTRLEATQEAVNNLASSLLGHNGQDGNPNDTVEMALVSFATTAQTNVAETTSTSTFTNAVNNLNANGGTNWEAALRQANGIDFGDEDPTFVIFFSDGSPTFHSSNGGYNNWNQQYGVYGSGQEQEPNMTRSYTQATDDAVTVANKVGATNFYTIFAYGTDAGADYMTDLTAAAGAPAENNYSASDTAALQDAFNEILAKIEMAGFADVDIEDGTTNQVTTTSGVVMELLEVDENSYQYYRSGGANSDGTTPKYDPSANTFTPVGGTAENIGVEWTASDSPAPPEAKLVDGAVEWDLSPVGVLENEVTYTVTFDVYPSQTTYDIIAMLDNGDIEYGEITEKTPAEVWDYIKEDGSGGYTLATNTTATLDYDDTRTPGEESAVTYPNPKPVATTADELTITKKWEGANPPSVELPITVMMDDEEFHTASLTGPAWETTTFISVGIIKNGQALPGAMGHDFSFAELDDTQYRWELDSPTVRPMLVDGTLTMLVKVDDDHPAPSGATTYTIGNNTYYADTAAGGLEATNYRRSNLNLKKVVTGEDAPEDAMFPFTVTVNNSKAPASEPTDDPEHNSDYWVWFSIDSDPSEEGFTPVTEGVTVSGNGVVQSGDYWYAPSGTEITVDGLKADWNLRFTNLPSGSTYTFTEGDDFDEGFVFNKAENTGEEDSTFTTSGQTAEGTIETPGNKAYEVTFTNDYALTDLEITKVWEDADDQDGIRPSAEDFAEYLTLSPAVEGAEPDIVDNEDGTYTITYTGLPRFNNGQEVEYTVAESAIDGYTTTGSPAKDKGTITNTHTPEVTEVTVVKVWDDSDDIGGIRPASINVQLTADGTASGAAVALNEGNEWTYTWENLPKYSGGEEIEYTADETAVPAGYTKTGPEKEVAEDGTITFTVTNTYTPTPVSVDPPVQKVITGNEELYNGGDFTFTIEAVTEGAPMPENTEITNSATYELEGNTGYYEFGVITFTKPGTYQYKVTESGEVDGVTNDEAATTGKTLTFTVTDDGTGKLEVTPTTDQVQMSFTNVYDADGEASIVVSKEITGAAWPAGKTLTLTIAGANGAPMPDATTATLNAAGSVTFGPIEYGLSDAGKSYEYTITESSFGAGWSGAPASVKATVEVTDNGDGTLGTTVTYDPTEAKFTNTYTATGTATLEVTKAISGAPWPTGKTLTLTLAGTESAPMPAEGGETRTLTAAGSVTFGTITYTEADAGKTYTYTISEDEFGDGWTGSGDVTATVVVTDNGDGTLSTDVTYSPEDATITNTYEADGEATIEVTKELAGAAWPSGKTLTFTLAGEEGAPMPEETTVDLTAAGKATFDTIAYDQTDVGKTYEYTITESSFGAGWSGSPESITATVAVTDNGDGTLGTTVTYSPENATFTNTYKATGKATLEATKAIEGAAWPEGKTITFTLAGEGGTLPATKTVTLSEPGKATFGDITYTEADAGKTYTYTISEDGFGDGWTGTPTSITATVAVTDNGDGTLATAVTYSPDDATITNTYEAEGSATIEVTKKLAGATWPEGKTLTFTLAAETEGAPMPETTTVDLTAAGKATFASIPYTEADAGKVYKYTITEGSFGEGWEGSPESITATVTVTDNGDGTLGTAVTYDPADATFTNTYDASGSIKLEAKKVLNGEGEGATLKEGQFSFTVYDADGNVVATASNKADGTVEFSEIQYVLADAGRQFTYTMKENIPDSADENNKVGNITYDDTEYTVNVTVTDNKDGRLIAEADKTSAELVFTNTYTPDPTSATVNITKTLTGVRDLEAGEFSFLMVPNGTVTGDPVPAEGLTGTVNADGTAAISAGVYTRADTYYYTVSEVIPETPLGGVTYDETEHTVTVTVVDNNGKLEATVSPESVAFENQYDTKGDGEIDVKKVYEGKNWTDEEFTFELYNSDGEKIDEKTLTKDEQEGTFELKDLTPGEYKYKLKEVIPSGAAEETPAEGTEATDEATTDAAADQATDQAADAATDQATDAAADQATDAATDQAADAASTDEAQPEAASDEAPAADEAKPEETPAEAPAADEAKPEEGDVQSGSILNRLFLVAYAEDGDNIVETENGKIEYDDTEYEVIVTVTDNKDGTCKVEVEYPNGDVVTFKNQYTPNPASVNPEADKTLTGLDLKEGMFQFKLTGNGQNVTVSNDAEGKVTFPQMRYTAEDAGKTYEYTVSEVKGDLGGVAYDETKYTFTVSVEYDADAGKLTATMSGADGMSFVNTYSPAEVTVNLKAHKTLEGSKLSEGEFAFVVENSAGEVVASGTNDASGNVSFGGLTFAEEGTYIYTIREVNTEVENITYDESVYTVTITVTDNKSGNLVAETSIEGGPAEFINTYIPPEEDEEEPPTPSTGVKTGDETNIMTPVAIFIGAVILLLIALAVAVVRRKRDEL